jgi:hypothetical protein
MKYSFILIAAASLLTFQVPAMALEEPDYTVVESTDSYEIRHYPPYLVAEVDVRGDLDDAGNAAFRILAGYIFGDNQAAAKMNMTAPVESTPNAASEKMAMTAPVTAVSSDAGSTTFAFVMERKYTMDTLPVPNDERVRIREMPERMIAVRRYSGRWTEQRYEENLAALQDALAASGLETEGAPILARYNSPFSLPIFRRNEVMLEVLWEGEFRQRGNASR